MNFTLEAALGSLDTVGMGIGIALLLMSVISWMIIFKKMVEAFMMSNSIKKMKEVWKASKREEYIRKNDRSGHFLDLYGAGASWVKEGDGDKGNLHQVLRQQVENTNHRLESGLTLLATIGATAPFVGLLGTVWGIYNAMSKISVQKSVDIAMISGPIGEALLMTAFGLGVALPAVFAYNLCVRSNQWKMMKVEGFAFDLQKKLEALASKSVGEVAKAT